MSLHSERSRDGISFPAHWGGCGRVPLPSRAEESGSCGVCLSCSAPELCLHGPSLVHLRRSAGGSPYAVCTAAAAKAAGGASGSLDSGVPVFPSGLPEHLMRKSSRAWASPLHQESIVLSGDSSYPDRWISSLANCMYGWYDHRSLLVQRPCPVSSVRLCTTFS